MNVSSLGRGKLVEQCGTGPYRSSLEELPLHIHGQLSGGHKDEALPLPAVEQGSGRTDCALLRRLMGVWLGPSQNHTKR